ncbi:MAG: PEP-CTERM sorting domain-containing protein [Leptolyngbya sp. SIOISBB]|nr:PEP-CTERM sorting domain-containing protein [Leptolyngbya sp. SIOISBB]
MRHISQPLCLAVSSTALMLAAAQNPVHAVSFTNDTIDIAGETGLQIVREGSTFGGEEWIKASVTDGDPNALTQARIDAGFRLATRTDIEGLLDAYVMALGTFTIEDNQRTEYAQFGVSQSSPSFTSFLGTTAGTVLNGIYVNDQNDFDLLTVTNEAPLAGLPANSWRIRPSADILQANGQPNRNRAFLLVRDAAKVPEPTALLALFAIGGIGLVTKHKSVS